MVDSTDIDIKQLQNTVKKLLDKAGTDARLTPRLLREKVEQRMKLEPGALTCKKSDIMDEIIKWWKETQPAIKAKDSVDAHATELTALQSITKYAKAVGKGPHFLKEFLQDSDVEKAKDIRKRYNTWYFSVSNTFYALRCIIGTLCKVFTSCHSGVIRIVVHVKTIVAPFHKSILKITSNCIMFSDCRRRVSFYPPVPLLKK